MTIKTAIKILKNERACLVMCDREILQAYDFTIKTLEQTQWIPCSERLPEYMQEVLFSLKNVVYSGTYGCKNDIKDGFYDDIDCSRYEEDEVLAWMPLPKPYKVERI